MNKKKDEIVIETSEVEKEFKEYIDSNNDSRIFFSGKFGVGKTWFLKKFFEKEKENYEVFHLFPINYQIHDNYNIIELLKYDILIELLSEKDIFDGDNNKGFLLFVKEHFTIKKALRGVVDNVLPFVPYGKELGRPMKTSLDIDEKFQEYKQGDKTIARKFIEDIKKIDTKELDIISAILNKKIKDIKGNKKSVLILDDLDRLDPEHIFRILNIFSSFYDQNEKNIFGFDKVIIVGDYDNIKNIFHHKYGKNTDFDGYIDKFFTLSPYFFDNKKAMWNAINNIVEKTKISDKKSKIIDICFGKELLKYFLVRLSESKYDVTVRKLLKIAKYNILILDLEEYKDTSLNTNNKKRFSEIIEWIFKIIYEVIGDKESIVSFLRETRGENEKYINGDKEKKKNYKHVGSCDNGVKMYKYYINNMLENIRGMGMDKERNGLYSSYRNKFEEITEDIEVALVPGGGCRRIYPKLEDIFLEIFIDYIENYYED